MDQMVSQQVICARFLLGRNDLAMPTIAACRHRGGTVANNSASHSIGGLVASSCPAQKLAIFCLHPNKATRQYNDEEHANCEHPKKTGPEHLSNGDGFHDG
jgi:hypothetical protein